MRRYVKLSPEEKDILVKNITRSYLGTRNEQRSEIEISRQKVFIVSVDGTNFYKVHAQNQKKAIDIVMTIGENPPPETSVPPLPGDSGKIPTKVKTGCYRAVKISKKNAIRLLSLEKEARTSHALQVSVAKQRRLYKAQKKRTQIEIKRFKHVK